MASTTHRNLVERLRRQGWRLVPPRSPRPPPSRWLRFRAPSWRRLLRRLPLYAGLVVAAAALALILAATVPRLFGYHTFIVYGGSMAPTLHPGDVALTRPVAAGDVQVGDIIATRATASATPVLHRVTAIVDRDGQRQFIIKGDRNDSADPGPVLLMGSGNRVVHRVPLAGYLIHFVRTVPGRLLFLVLPALFLGTISLWEIWRPRRVAEAPTPLSASEATAPGASPVTVPAPSLEVVRPEPPSGRAKAPSRASSRAPSRPAASGVPKGARKPRAAGKSATKGRSTSRKASRGKSDGQRRSAA